MASQGLPPYIPYLKLYALAAVGVQTGMIISMSYPTIPALLNGFNLSKPSLLSVWSSVYHRGKASMPPLAVTASVSFLAVAYGMKNTAFAVAGILPPFIVPFTLTVMRGNVGRLLEMAEEVGVTASEEKKEGQEEEEEEVVGALDVDEVRQEIDRWGALNLLRATFPLSGFVVGLWATIF